MNNSQFSNEQIPQLGKPMPQIPPHLAAVWGAFLHEGIMLNSRNSARSSRILEAWNQGCLELICAVCEFIPEIWKQVQPYWYGSQGFTGVFVYEVTSILGEQLATYILEHDGKLPSHAEVEHMTAELVVTFFSIGGTHEQHSEREPQTERLINLHDRFLERLDQLAGDES